MEAEFYVATSNSQNRFVLGKDAIDFVQYGTSEGLNEEENGFPILRLNEFDSYFIGKPSKFCDKIDSQTYETLKLTKGDVLICRTNGNPRLVGKSAFVPKDYEYAFASYLFRVRPKKEIISPECLMIYLNSRVGRAEIEKYAMVSNQANFSPAKFREIQIPILDFELQEKINNLVKQAHAKLEESKALYAEAENLLLAELGLRDWSEPPAVAGGLNDGSSNDKGASKNAAANPPATAGGSDNYAVKSFRESFQATGRLDAEYYQPKYDGLFKTLTENTQAKGWTLATLGSLSEPLRYGSSTKLEYLSEGVPFLRIADVRNYRFDKENLKYISVQAAKDESFASVKKGDVIISRSGTLGLSIAITSELEGAIFGSYFIRVRPNEGIISDFLALFLNSKVGQMQVQQLNTGGIQTNLTVPAIESLKISLPPREIQEKFVEKVKESFQTQDQSKHLLETARRAVEMAIEADEETAENFIISAKG